MFRNSANPTPYRVRLWALLAASVMLLLLSGCVKNEFSLIFSLPESVNSTYRLAYYASDARGGIEVESAVAVAAGKGEMTGITRNPTLVFISTGHSDIPSAIFYAERGDKINISGPDADPLGWTIGSNKVNSQLTEWRLKNSDLIKRARLSERDASDPSPRKALNKAVAAFITANADSKAAPLLLTAYFDAAAEPTEYRRLSRLLEESGALDPMIALMARHDVLTATSEGGKTLPLRDIILRTREGYCDTLRLGESAPPTLIYFWRRNEPRHSEIIDTLKRLVRWRPDSASMPIADIALTTDSLQWAGVVRRDSLRHTLRSFSPHNLADTTAMSLGVRTTPWFIVTSGKKTIYSGSDLAAASRSYRSLKN